MDALQDEVESLEAILMDDVRITRNTSSGIPEIIETTVFPVIGDEADQQYVCITLQVLPTVGYPDVSPDFKLLRPRGLDDARIEAIRTACSRKLQQSLGFPVVFDLIEVVREHLTGSNLPSGQCVVCLYGFSDGDEFTRTECFHYLHSYCLGRHLNASRRNYHEEFDKLPAWLQKTAEPFQAACPVCREHIKDDVEGLRCAMPPAELQNAPDFKLTRELRELQQRMSTLFLQQKSRGGIIDVEAESAAVISIETEEEVRRRLQRKHYETESAASNNSGDSPNRSESTGKNCIAAETGSRMLSAEQSDSASTKPSSSNNSTQQTIRATAAKQDVDEATNNNHAHHNRRHYRGGRRHQQHHHHHRDRERERERYEHNHLASHSNASNATAATSGKQQKAQATGGGHPR